MYNQISDFMRILALLNQDDLAADAKYPASGSFEPVTEYEFFAFLIHTGDVAGTATLQVQQDTDATQTGSIKAITGAVQVLVAGDVNNWLTIEVESSRLDIGNGFTHVTLDVSGGPALWEAGLWFLAWKARGEPVTQEAAYKYQVVVAG